MSNNIEEAIEILEKLKETLKYQYDYFKYMTTLSAGSIMIIIALLEGIFKEPKGKAIIMVSIICFLLSLIFSLIIMSTIGNIILYMTAIYSSFIAKNIEYINKMSNKAISTFNKARVFNILHNIFFFLGIVILVCFAMVNFL